MTALRETMFVLPVTILSRMAVNLTLVIRTNSDVVNRRPAAKPRQDGSDAERTRQGWLPIKLPSARQ
jgi:hypothetical protein